MIDEYPLPGGHSGSRVVRVGATIRKPWTEHSAGVVAYLAALAARGVDVPAVLERDSDGRMVTEFVEGPLAGDRARLSHTELRHVGAIVRQIHDASRGLDAQELGLGAALIPAPSADLVCHGDLTPWNLICGPRWVFIDWDGAAASSRVWDLAYSAQSFTLNEPDAEPADSATRLRSFVDGYGAGTGLRAELAEIVASRTWAMHDLLANAARDGREPWGSMFADGHGDHWRAVARYVETHESVWRAALE